MNLYNTLLIALLLLGGAIDVKGKAHHRHFFEKIIGAYNHRRPHQQKHGQCRAQTSRQCGVKFLSSEHAKHCIEERKAEVERSRLWYQVTDETKPSIIKFPLKTVPFLNQTISDLKLHYAVDKEESRYFVLFSTWITIATGIGEKLAAAFGRTPIKSFQVHKTIFNLHNQAVQGIGQPEYFGNPAMEPTFTDHVNQPGDIWRTDEAFVQRRLASICPFLLRKVTQNDEIGFNAYKLAKIMNKNVLNDKFEVDVGGHKITLVKAIEDGRLFVLYNEEMDGRKAVPDITDLNTTDNRVLRELSSPISLFVLKNDGMLSVVAIQWDSKPESPVYFPTGDKLKWEIAKVQAELVADTYCQAGPHLGGIHMSYTVFCLVYRRHFSRQHPLYDLFKFHCEGTVPLISTAYQVLLDEYKSGHKYFSIGHSGFADIASNEFNNRFYGHMDFRTLVKKRGLDDKRIKYYPFRDDALVILRELRKFTSKVVNMYYKTKRYYWKGDKRYNKVFQSFDEDISNNDFFENDEKERQADDGDDDDDDDDDVEEDDMFYPGEDDHYDSDRSVLQDKELQSFANEVSNEGKISPDGGKGKFIEFPSKFVNKRQLKQFILRFLWYNIIHITVNYPLAPEFMPIILGKSYTRKDGEIGSLEELYAGYAEPVDAVVNIAQRGRLSNLRANRLFDYFENVRDQQFGRLVRKAYSQMQDCVQKELAKRNAERKAKNLLGFQYFEPIWLTNSVHI